MPNHLISLEEAVNLTTTYQAEKDSLLCEEYQGRNILPVCETFDRADIDTLLAQEGCVGLRIYLGMDNNALVKVVLVGVDANNDDLLDADNSIIVEMGRRCPVDCPNPSPLNS